MNCGGGVSVLLRRRPPLRFFLVGEEASVGASSASSRLGEGEREREREGPAMGDSGSGVNDLSSGLDTVVSVEER